LLKHGAGIKGIARSGSTVRILLVDDENEGRSFLAGYFALLGADVTQCASSEEALRVFDEGRFDLVISDVMMGGLSGLDLTVALNTSGRRPLPAIILYSGSVDTALPEAAARAGAYAYLSKPINFGLLRSLLTEIGQSMLSPRRA